MITKNSLQISAMNKMQCEESLNTTLNELDGEINFLRKMVKDYENTERQKLNTQITLLQRKRDELFHQVDQIKVIEDTKWQNTKEIIQESIQEKTDEIDTIYKDIKMNVAQLYDHKFGH